MSNISQYDVYKRDIILLHNEMEKFTLQAGVSEKVYRSVILDLEEFEEEEVKALYEWLQNIRDHQYQQYKYVWELLSEEMWDRYNAFGMKDTREQRMLKEAVKAMKTAWEKPYRSGKQLQRIASKKGVNRHKL